MQSCKEKIDKEELGEILNPNSFSVPLKAKYKLLQFSGNANGTLLTPNFLPIDIQNRYMVLKSLRLVPYTNNAAGITDIKMDDGAGTVFTEVIPTLTRVERVLDQFNVSAIINFLINGSQVPIFTYDPTLTGYPLDLHVDNIFYKYPAKIQTMTCSVSGFLTDNAAAPAAYVPYIKVLIECYLL